MRSQLPKVLHPIMGKPMLQHVLAATHQLNPAHIWLIYGHQGAQIQAAIQDPTLKWVEQQPQLGTGHALMQLYPQLVKEAKAEDNVLIVSADGPALNTQSLRKMIDQGQHDSLVLLNIILEDPTGFGRIIRNPNNEIIGIVEEKDANVAQKNIQEIYSGIMLVKFGLLTQLLPQLTNQNLQKEYYLTQLIELACQKNIAIGGILTKDPFEARGINDRIQLAELERYMQLKKAKELMLDGVTIVDPSRFDLRGTLQAGQDVWIDNNCIFEGEVSIGEGSRIGTHCILRNCQIGRNVTIHPFTLIEEATVGDHSSVGPFARLRPGTILEECCHVGNFVEVKKTHLGKRSKAGHLSYLGDAKIGEDVNIGAGTITCNYDGANKHETHIGDAAFIGSHTSLVAPVTIGAKATIGAGSIITKNAPDDKLTLSRSPQKTIDNWARPKK